ncbi:MAG: transglutaminase-like domain-containing protein [Candidatus Roizmanbacteria bacterium]
MINPQIKFKYQILKVLKILLFFLTLTLFVRFSSTVYAADFKTDYQVEYNLTNFKETLTSQVRFNIKITNLRGDVYVNKFAISFPKSFKINNLQSTDDHGLITPKITTDENNTKVEMEFSNPNVGRDTVNNFYLNFDQSNLFQINGKVWEVVLPVIENKESSSYKVIVNLPQDGGKKISIAKPKPNLISGNQIIWDNPTEKTIYAVFGESQIYKAELIYNLKNNEVFPVITEIAFPPDSLYQKIFIQSISPEPSNVYQDGDGNYLGKYFLKPLESKKITFRGFIQIFPTFREEVKNVMRQTIKTQKTYLLGSQKYWTINNLEKINGLKSIEDIYNFTVNNLKYNYQKLNSDNSRLGADGILSRPDQAVCLEFTDLFVGISREKGIMAREIEGYSFSFDPQLQPLSLVSDVLHAWPEYYNEETGFWIPVDPTWENTSGIDYFSSFDLNHIVFAIHGKKSDYPLPAGMYKVGDSKDISIKATIEDPIERKSIGVKNFSLPSKITDKKNYQGKFTIRNNSNVYLWDIPIDIKTTNLKVDKKKTKILSLAPYEEKSVNFNFEFSKTSPNKEALVKIFIFDKEIDSGRLTVIPRIYEVGMKVGIGIFIGITFILIIKKFRK